MYRPRYGVTIKPCKIALPGPSRPQTLVISAEKTINNGQRLDLCPFWGALLRPITAGMQRIPPTSVSTLSVPALWVVPETVYFRVPDRAVVVYQKPLCQRYPNGNH